MGFASRGRRPYRLVHSRRKRAAGGVGTGRGGSTYVYIAASDLVPEVNKQRDMRRSAEHFGCFLAGAGLLYLLALVH